VNSGTQPPFHKDVRIRFKSESQIPRSFVTNHFYCLNDYCNVLNQSLRPKFYFHHTRHSSDSVTIALCSAISLTQIIETFSHRPEVYLFVNKRVIHKDVKQCKAAELFIVGHESIRLKNHISMRMLCEGGEP
jgi:hypothetical protein